MKEQQPASAATPGLLDTLKHKSESLLSSFSWDNVMRYGICFVGGMLSGFIIKRFGKQLLHAIIGAFCIIAILYYFHIITIDWAALRSTGIFPGSTLEGALQEYVRLIRVYIIEVVIATIGFIIGYKMS